MTKVQRYFLEQYRESVFQPEAKMGEHPEGYWVRYSDYALLLAQREELRKALQALYGDTASYITVNNLGDVHHNESMKLARAALAKGDV